MKETSTQTTTKMDQEESFIGPVSLAAVIFGDPVDVEVEYDAEDDEPKRQELPGEPEMQRQVEDGETGQHAPGPGPLAGGQQNLEAEGEKRPAGQDGEDDQHLIPHVPLLGAEQV